MTGGSRQWHLLLLLLSLWVHKPVPAWAQPATAQQSLGSCSSRVQRITCYYDFPWGAISGVVLESVDGSVQTLCREGSSPGTVIDVPSGAGIDSVVVSATSNTRRVTRLEFRFSNGDSRACTPLYSTMRGRRLAQSIADTAAAIDSAAGSYISSSSSSSSSSTALEDLWAVANTTTTQVIILNSSSIANSAAAIAATDSTIAATGDASAATAAAAAAVADPTATAAAAAATGAIEVQHSHRNRDGSNMNRAACVVMLQGRTSSTQAPWLAGLSGECNVLRRTGRTALMAPVTACWVPADGSGGGSNTELLYSVQGSTVMDATVTNARFDSSGLLISGRITRGRVEGGVTSSGRYIMHGDVRSGRVTSAQVSGASVQGTTLIGARLDDTSMRTLSVDNAEMSDTPPPPPPPPPPPSPSPELPQPSPSPEPQPSPSPEPEPSPSPQPQPSPSPLPPPPPSPSPLPPPPSPSPLPSPSPSPQPPPSPSPSPSPEPSPSPSPSPEPSPSPSPSPEPSPSPSPSPEPSPSPSPSPEPSPSPSPSPEPSQSPSPSPEPSPSPSPSPEPSPSPSPEPSPSPQPPLPSPSPQPPPNPSPSLNISSPSPSPPFPMPSPSPPPSPSPAGPSPSPRPPSTANLVVTLFARGKSSCSPLPDAARTSLDSYLGGLMAMMQVTWPYMMLALPSESCECQLDPMQQNVPQWSCPYRMVLGNGSGLYTDVPDAALHYMTQTISAGGQEFCASVPTPSGVCEPNRERGDAGCPAHRIVFCDQTLGITGLCAGQPSSNGTFCRLSPVTQSSTMLTTLASAGRDCLPGGKRLTPEGMASLADYLTGFVPGFRLTVVQDRRAPLQCVTEYGNSYFAVPVLIAPNIMLDTAGAGEYAAAKLTQLQYFPCMNTTGVSTTPAFCTEFDTPAMCGSPTYAFQADGRNIPQCAAAGSSSVLNVLNPETCEAGVPPEQYATDITAWLTEQMSYVATRFRDILVSAVQADATQKPETVSGAPYCKFTYRIMVTGNLTTPPETLKDLGLSMMGNALGMNGAFQDVTCAAYEQSLALCKYWSKAKMCSAYPWSDLVPYKCDFE